jgi:hypothetical protein
MRTRSSCVVTGAIAAAAIASAPGTARADEHQGIVNLLGQSIDKWEQVDGKFQLVGGVVKGCRDYLDRLTKANVPDSYQFDLDHDTPRLKAGKHAWTEGRATCDDIMTAAARRDVIDIFVGSAYSAESDMKKTGPRHFEYFRNCMTTYDDAIKAGIPATEPVKDRDGKIMTMLEMREQWCAAGKAQLDAARAEKTAKYDRLLKNDKLKIALRDEGFITLPGHAKPTVDAMAANNVWFEDASPDKVCANGLQIHVLHRYQFDGAQKLAKVTDKDFCGKPPGAAFH